MIIIANLEIEKGSYYDTILDDIIHKVKKEFLSATQIHGEFNSTHEGFAVLHEEFDELWDAIKLNHKDPERESLIEKNAIQVSAMAIRLIFDCVL